MHSIDKANREMNREYWGMCISNALESVKLTCEQDCEEFHSQMKALLDGSYVQPLHNYERWDGNFSKTSEEKQKIRTNIVGICR
jgi:hypothetical protein